MNRRDYFTAGIKDGIPICLGYIAVSFTFGIMAGNAGLSVWESVLISATNLTSAGQFAGLSLIASAASYVEMAVTQLIINLRYCLMSCALSQKFDSKVPFFHRLFVAYGVTDEIFGVSVSKSGKLSPFYSYGAISISAFGWIFGTLLGTVSGNILPARIVSALSVALYGMFIAIIIPPSRDNKVVAGIVIISMLMSLFFTKAPVLCNISSGFRIIILTLLIAGAAAVLFPVTDEEKEGTSNEQ
ncbi:MAG: AzlC family ABC transporter permease [Schaedlerella sp.]|nr:AzlC family ABC transporter permease [Lachnospiraceae bacterium]MDY4202331.1 AzlC family ABC transporter permease [Schaedlerella sp.]